MTIMQDTPILGLPAELDAVSWRISSFSGSDSSCVAVAPIRPDCIAVRNSNRPGAGAVYFTEAEWDAFIRGAQAGEFGITAGRFDT
jgi:hypothetical protein